jgi:2-oxoglutarate dehydrogenase E1 component
MNKMEPVKNSPSFTPDQKLRILTKLSQAVQFEKFIHKKFPGQKRFSLEGGESLIPALDAVIEKGVEFGNQEFVIGMPHRGRLNVLSNILQKPYSTIFTEFQGLEYEDELILGDVKYHLGYTSERTTQQGVTVKLTLAPNPSHLETVNPVVEGIARARLDKHYEGDFNKITPVLIHGDAAIAGQGVVYEVVQMSGLKGYNTGGTIHLVVNNQIGFTTNYLDARTSTYCTDVAKTIQSPVFHVNADDAEAVAYTIQLAMEFREKFHRDVFVDLLGYRKYGHNEGDEPRFTQPVLYKIIEKHPDPRQLYVERLIQEGVLTNEAAAQQEKQFNDLLEDNLLASKDAEKANISNFLANEWEGIRKATPADFVSSPNTGVDVETFMELAKRITYLPEEKSFFRKIRKLYEDRMLMVSQSGSLDWAMGELMAYATLVHEGFAVRVSGQDVERGTFSHRHAALTIEDSEEKYVPLKHIVASSKAFEIYNSSLSEYGVLGFEYGYALNSPNTLTIWEAQFGDFGNGAQIIFDQFISSAEDKWNVMNGLVVLLPHGFEGQGPEHSSARMERYLTLCAEYNIQVLNCTTPASFFHAMRRQLKRDFRKPLIVFTPKSLLRHPACVSPVSDFVEGRFVEVIDDAQAKPEEVSRVVFCTGKVYYDLLEDKNKNGNKEVAIIRLEQLFPVPAQQIEQVRQKYNQATQWIWVQEEPANMGAWGFLRLNASFDDFKLVARPASGSPATGSSKFHQIQQKKIVDKAMHQCNCPRLDWECRMVCIGNKWQSFARETQNIVQE